MSATEKYAAIIALSRPISRTHRPMPQTDRAAQFAPFAALNGHSDEICETARQTDTLGDYDENKICEIDTKLRAIADSTEKQPSVSLIYFRPDAKKSGGAYVHFTGKLKRIDKYERVLVFTDTSKIKIDTICDIFLQ